ncbi:MAG: bacteriohemerythrin [Blautia sp.]|nr:bacteriohemerythrin [Lachnoclostridium sp.]MCM1210302.1 bacteriohemerythrin [Blautia sp.]
MYYFTDDCLIGMEMIDNEHRELFRIINETQELLENEILEDKYDRIRVMLERLKDYAEEHFAHEENYMAGIHHPELNIQKQQHLVFSTKISEADAVVDGRDQQEFLEDLLKYLVKWLYRHIIGSDLMIGKMRPLEEIHKIQEFTDEYLTGIPVIDKEHKELFRIIGDAQRLIADEYMADKYDDIIHLIKELKDYTKFHFEDEEEYMKKIDYPGLEAQKRAHDAFVGRLEEIDLDKMDENQQETLEELMNFLTEWLINHILNSDKKIGNF